MDRAIPFIEGAVAADKPFFAVIWFHAPHVPVVGGPQYRAMYAEYEEDKQHYYAVRHRAGRTGRPAAQADCDELGVGGNTMLWFCSDNGPEGNRPKRGATRDRPGRSADASGRSTRAACACRGCWSGRPSIQQPRAVDVPCVTSDYFPTVLDVPGLEGPRRPAVSTASACCR